MKKIGAAAFLLILWPAQGYAQWDYGQHAIDNIIESRIDARKTRARIRARRGGKIKADQNSKSKKSALGFKSGETSGLFAFRHRVSSRHLPKLSSRRQQRLRGEFSIRLGFWQSVLQIAQLYLLKFQLRIQECSRR